VAAYSRLMGAGQKRTHQRLKTHLAELIDPNIRSTQPASPASPRGQDHRRRGLRTATQVDLMVFGDDPRFSALTGQPWSYSVASL
jgi:hypothetical protein